ncbi:hypothetical protein B0J14DRAFT_659090 [Halenospora varia]|nr:hypothetical protein B0J14DRAFT_659090 [Halenospora varia]
MSGPINYRSLTEQDAGTEKRILSGQDRILRVTMTPSHFHSANCELSTDREKLGDEAMIQQPIDEKKGLFNRGFGGRRKKNINSRNRSGIDGEEVFVNGLGRFYNKIVNFSIITRYFVYILPVALLLAAPIVVFAVQNPHAIFANTGIRVTLFWLWIEIVWLSIWVSKLAAKVVPWMFMFLCGVASSGTWKYALILRAVEIPLSLVGWAVTCLVTFTALTSPKLNGGIPSNEKLAVQLISINYHRRTFAGRITQSKRDVHLMGLLYEASRTLFPMYCQEFIGEDYIINNSTEPILAKTRRHYRRSGSATHLKLISDVGRLGDKVTSMFGNIASEITGMQVFNPDSAHSIHLAIMQNMDRSLASFRAIDAARSRSKGRVISGDIELSRNFQVSKHKCRP